MSERFERPYWTEGSDYRKFADYAAALAGVRRWYQGFFRLVGPELPPAGRSLDAGCGHGAIVYELAARGFDACGFDVSGFMVEQAREANPGAASRFAVGELPAVPSAGSFDLVTCLEVLEHLPDPVAALRSLGARLGAGGRLIATTQTYGRGSPGGTPRPRTRPTSACTSRASGERRSRRQGSRRAWSRRSSPSPSSGGPIRDSRAGSGSGRARGRGSCSSHAHARRVFDGSRVGGAAVGFRAMTEPTTDDIDVLIGPATPHFAYQLRARVWELIEDLPEEHPVRRYGEEKMELLDRLGHASSFAADGTVEPRSRIGWDTVPSSAPAFDPLPKRSA